MGNIYNINQKLKQIAKVLTLVFVFAFTKSWGQTIVSDNFENTSTLFTSTGTTYYLGNTGGSDGPANSPQATLGTYGIGANNTSAVLTSSIVDVSNCISPQLSFKLASISLTSATNGADATDNVIVEVSPDGGTTYYNTIQINGNSNAYWAYSATGVASTPYDGNVTPVTFAPAGGGSRNADGYSTITVTGLPTVAILRIRITLLNNAANEKWIIDNFVISGSCGSPNTITTGSVSNPPFALTDCTVTASGAVAFTSSGTFTGNTYTAQLSNASGSFATPTNIGTLVSNANSGTINITIPASTASGTGYLIRVVSNSPNVTGSSSAAFTITLTCASPSGTCTVVGAMGNNETNDGCGSSAPCFLASIYSAYGNFCNNVDNTGCTSCITANVSAVYTLPSGCTASVKAEYKNRGTGCSNSAMDGGDQLYITNSGGTLIGQSANLTGCGAFSSGVSSTIASGCGNGDGVVTMTLSGGQFTVGGTVNRGDEIITYTINFSGTCGLNCPTLLPISLLDFFGIENGSYNDIIWKVANEDKIENYVIEKSEDGINFRELSIQHAKGNGSGNQLNYYIQDNDPSEGMTYYRLSTIEGSGNWNVKQIKTISLDRRKNDWKSQIFQKDENLIIEFKNAVPKNSKITLYDLAGKLLGEKEVDNSQTIINTQDFAEGIYFVKISTPYKIENFKIIIQK